MSINIVTGDCRTVLAGLPDQSFNMCVTSPPYFGLRDYGVDGQMGLEATPDAFVAELVAVFREVRRVLRDDGALFLNLGDSYFGGGRGGGSEGSKQRSNKGAPIASPKWPEVNGASQHEGAYGRLGKGQSGSLERDCFCRSLCDACRAAYQIGITHSGRRRAPTPAASTMGSTRPHRQSQSSLPPMSGCLDQNDHTAGASPGLETFASLEAARPLGGPGSTTPVSSRTRPEGFPRSDRPSECQLCGCSLQDCAPLSVRMEGCNCGTSSPGLASDTWDTDASGSTYPHLTTTFLKPKDLIGIPWMVAFALRADGWFLRQDIIWAKPNPMPESVADRCTKAHEYIFMLTKRPKYYYDADAIKNPPSEALLRQVAEGYAGEDTKDFAASGAQSASGTKSRIIENARKKLDKQRGHARPHEGFNDRWDSMTRDEQLGLGSNKRSVWTVATQPFSDAHFATFPPALIEPCILAGCPMGGSVLDPFGGAGTTGLVADRLGRSATLIELNPEYAEMARRRISGDAGMFADVEAA